MHGSFFIVIATVFFINGCSDTQQNSNAKTINAQWIDSIIKVSDSSYSKPYNRADFVTAAFYINKKDSSVFQLMKDSGNNIRQVIIARDGIRTYFAQYFANGNLQADLPLDDFGQYHGTGTFYYENGQVQSTGLFNHGLKTGQWKVFDEKGRLTATDSFDKNGQLIQQH